MGDNMERLKIWWHKFFDTGYSELMMWQDIQGKFIVIYPDNKVSKRMAYSTAKDYKAMFGGQIYYYKNITKPL